MSTPEKQPSVAITVEDDHSVRAPVPPSTAKSEKPKAFLTQSRTGSGSKYSQVSGTYSVGVSTTLDSRYQNGGGLAPGSKPGGRSDSAEGDSGIDEEKESPSFDKQEALDKVYPLPAGWPRLQDKLFKRRAMFFRKPMSPSIAKAAEQLRLLQDRIEAWSREVELDILSRRSSVISAASEASKQAVPPSRGGGDVSTRLTQADGKVRKQLRFATDTDRTESSMTSLSSSHYPTPAPPRGTPGLASSCDFTVQGVGTEISDMDSLADIAEETVPHLGAEEVIDEVVTLLGRLETDRGDTDELFKKEQVRVGWLQGKIDRISQKRLYELPKVVQQEHEACATDIAELKWHNAYRGRQKDRIQNQVENAEMLNSRLKEDIAFVEKHCYRECGGRFVCEVRFRFRIPGKLAKYF
eukprot:XP_003730402.1 PREDICTED: uncharacterized protein LOC100894094 [Strongylocentrotus purpuratus]